MNDGPGVTLVPDWCDDVGGTVPPIAVLGSLEVRRPDGSQIPVAARKHAELLVILAAERSTRNAGYLCELLWRGAPPASALVTLQGYVSRLRRTLTELSTVRIETEPGGYILRCVGIGTDLELLDVRAREARNAAADGDLRRMITNCSAALQLWRGDPMSDVEDIAELAAERARLEQTRSELVEMCATGLLTLGHAGRAVALLTGERERYPLRESIVRLLAVAQRDCGRTSEALDSLLRLRRDLRDQLGSDPAPETLRVEQEIRRATVEPVREVLSRTALFGRNAACAAIDRAWKRARHGLTVVTVRGQAGIGKTALVRDSVRRHNTEPFYTRGEPSAPLAPIATLAPWLDQATLAGRTVGGDPANPHVLAGVLAETARETGLAVAVVDDVQWADVDSLRIIVTALRTLRAHPVLMLLTHRDGRVAPEIASVLATLVSIGTRVDIELEPLEDSAMVELVRADLGDRNQASYAEIVDQSLGTPLLAEQLCDLVRAGRPRLEGASTVSEVIRAKLATVSGPAAELAKALATIGMRCTVRLAALVADRPGFDDNLDELVAAHIVSVSDESISFLHAMIQDAVRVRIGPLRSAALHARIADALDEVRPGDLAARALHRSAAALDGTDTPAARACSTAARAAFERGAFTDCVELANRGLRHADPVADHSLIIDLECLAGQAGNRLGDYSVAHECFERAGALCSERGDWTRLARVALLGSPAGVGGFFSGYGVVQSGSSALRAAALAHREAFEAELVAQMCAIEAAERAVHGASGDYDALTEAQANAQPGRSSSWQVRLAEFVCTWEPATVAERAKIADELADFAGADRDMRATALHLQRVCALEAGDLRSVRRLSAEYARLAAGGGPDVAAMQLWWQVMIAIFRGEYERSRESMARFVENLGAVHGPARLLADASLLTGRSIEMWHLGMLGTELAEADRMSEEFDEDFQLVVAMAAAETGDHDRALRAVETTLALPGDLHGPRVAVRVPLLIEALLAVGQRAPEHRGAVRDFTARLEPMTAGWGDSLIVQWPGLVCLGPSGLYRATARGILGRREARDEVVAAARRCRELGARPYEERAAQRLRMWPFGGPDG